MRLNPGYLLKSFLIYSALQRVYFIIVLWANYLESAQVKRFQWTPCCTEVGFTSFLVNPSLFWENTDRKNVTDFLYLVLHLAHKVKCYFRLFSSVLVSVLRTSINMLSKRKSRIYVTWIANSTKLFLSVKGSYAPTPQFCRSCTQWHSVVLLNFACLIQTLLICASAGGALPS